MLTLAFLIALVATTVMINKKNNDNSQESLVFEKQDSLIIFGIFLFSILFDTVINKVINLPVVPIFIGGVAVYFLIFIVLNARREVIIKNRQDQIIKIYEALKDIFGSVDREDIDFGDIPFTFEIDKATKTVNYIKIDTSQDGIKSDENSITYAQYTINKFFTDFQWINTFSMQERELVFKGLPRPPRIAMWPGTDYRPADWIPLGVSGMGEVGWNLGNPKDLGHSSYVNQFPMGDSLEKSQNANHKPKDGFKLPNGSWIAGTVESPSAPQAMCVGTSGGGKSVMINQCIIIKDGDEND